MKNKFWFLVQNSFNRKAKSKWFMIANAILLVVLVALFNIDTIISKMGGEFNEKTKIYVIDNINRYDILKANIDEISKASDTTNYKLEKTDKTKKELKKELKSNEYIIVLDDDQVEFMKVTLVSTGYIDTLNYQILSTAINNTKVAIAIDKSNINPEILSNIYKPVDLKREYLDENKKSEDEAESMIMSVVFPIIILPFFMLSIFLVQMIGTEINDEKTTRGMEIIISNVSYKIHFLSKVIACNLFIFMQAALLFIYSGIGLLVRKLTSNPVSSGVEKQISNVIDSINKVGILEKLGFVIPLILILMVLTLIAYSLLAGILASMTTNAEDLGHLQSPIIIVSLVGYYLSIMAGVFKGALFIRIISYVPFISAILSPSLLVIGQVGIIDVLISILIMIITIILFIKYGLRVYKEGILNYTSKDLWKKMFKALKN